LRVFLLQVALRRRAAGKRDGVMAGETVPYIICIRLSNAAAAAAAAGDNSTGTPQQQQQQPEAAASPHQQDAAAVKQEQSDTAAASPAATPAAAAAGGSNGGVRAMTAAAAASRGGSAAGGIAERAYHPDELRTDPNLVIDAEYYLAQQVLPVVMRLCAPIEVRGGVVRVC
jgi:DNA polymerase alpha subunit A